MPDHLPQIHERRQVVDAFADIVDPRWINVDSFIESFATVNTFDVDEIFVRAATERQSRVLQLSRQLQAGTRTPFGRDHRRGGSAQQPYLEEPLWLSYADIAAVFEEAGVDPYVSVLSSYVCFDRAVYFTNFVIWQRAGIILGAFLSFSFEAF